MKTLIKILCLSSFLFAEDIYPYFSEPTKQLEFEKKRFYVSEVTLEKEILVSNNFFSTIISNYKYAYLYAIKKNNILIDEQKFLTEIGLNDEARNILTNQIDTYYSTIDSIYSNSKEYKDYKEHYDILKKEPKISKGFLLTAFIFHTAGLLVTGPSADLACHIIALPFDMLFLANLSIDKIYYKPTTLKDFKYKQALDFEQVKSLAESYNKKIYEDIKTK